MILDIISRIILPSLRIRDETVNRRNSTMREKVPRIGLIVNGPNVLLKRFNVKIKDISSSLLSFGKITIGKVVLSHNINPKLIETILESGLEPVIVNGRVDVAVAVEAMKIIYDSKIDILALAIRDAHFLPLVIEAKKVGKDVIVITPRLNELSDALQNTAEIIIELFKNPFEDSKSPKISVKYVAD